MISVNSKKILELLCILICACPLVAQEAYFTSEPAISPDGEIVCYVYSNDLWLVPFTGGIPRRITNTTSYEWNPQFSPDGKMLAFSSDRSGQNLIYIMPATGGEAKAVNYESFRISEWFSDSQNLLCTKYSPRWGLSFYKVPINGSRPVLLAEIGSSFATLSPDNKQIVFQKGGYSRREAYRGSGNGELWLIDLPTKKYTKLTNTELSELYPSFSQTGALYYCASDGKCFQINKVNKLSFRKPEKITNLKPFSARRISLSRNNDRLVFEYFNTIYKYDPTLKTGEKVSPLFIDLCEDEWQENIVRSYENTTIDDYTISTDELLVGFTHNYDSFFAPVKGGEAKQISFDHGSIFGLQFLDKRQMVISKLDNGIVKLFTATADSVITLSPVDWFGADSLCVTELYKDKNGRWYFKYDDYYRHQKIAIADSGFVNIRPVNTPWAVTTNFAFTEDGRYAVYGTLREDNYVKELYLYDVQADSSKRLLADNGWWQNLFWTSDNKSILLTRNSDIYRLDLVPRDEFELDTDPWDEILHPEKSKADSTNEEMQNEKKGIQEIESTWKEKKEEKPKPLEIVWEGLEKRFYPVITAKDNHNFVLDIISDSTFYYIENNGQQEKNSILKKANIYGKNQKEVFNFGRNTGYYNKVNNTVYYLNNKELKSYNLDTSARKDIKIKYDYKYDKALLNLRVFEEVWCAFGNNFYDPAMHNVPWKELFQLYRPYVEKAKDIYDVAFIIEEMIGDVNASHTGFYPREEYKPFTNPVAWLGADFDYKNILAEGIRLERIYPTSRLGSFYHLQDGCILTHIDEVKITAHTSLDSLLAGKIGKKIKLTILQEGNITEAVITGLSYSQMSELKYDYQIAKNKKLVDELSHGKLGYIHIPAMGENDWQKFYRDFVVDNFDKDALVIDVRGNYGGHIHDKLITLLQKKKYAYTTSRRYSRVMCYEPHNIWDKPSIVLVNEDSFSDGEIFPTVYQELKLGKVVGTPSSGAVIGTWHYYLQDGSSMRMPGTGWYKLDGTNMEGTGVQPDIVVENLPEDIIAERDPQLIRAVKELMKELK